jgi:uncharacterized membrane protein YcaP (DUF421 family)
MGIERETWAMFSLSVSIGELILRVLLIYLFLLILFRAVGKRHVGDLAPFDFVVLLILSESVQNSLIGDDKSVLGGMIATSTLIGLSYLGSVLSRRSRAIERVLEGSPRVLVRNGKVCDDVLAKEHISRNELLEALRKEGCTSLLRVRYAVLENDGSISLGLRVQR